VCAADRDARRSPVNARVVGRIPGTLNQKSGAIGMLQAQASTPLWLQIALPALTALLGLLSGLIVQERRARLELRAQRDRDVATEEKALEKERTAVRLEYLDPLLVAVRDYARRTTSILEKVAGSAEEKNQMYDWFHSIKHPRPGSLVDFAYWCNGEGYFAVSTLYLAAVYFHQVKRVRSKFPLNLLDVGEAEELLSALAGVRVALGKHHGIYTTLQDSVGEHVTSPDGSYVGYRVFCENLYREEERAWLLGVIDYYRKIRDKPPAEIAEVIGALDQLARTVELVSGLRREG
jgi:hypothetical protein